MSIILPGWTCACGGFNGCLKEPRTTCRCCDAPAVPDDHDAGTCRCVACLKNRIGAMRWEIKRRLHSSGVGYPLVNRNCVVDGQLRDYCDVVRDPVLAPLVSDQAEHCMLVQPDLHVILQMKNARGEFETVDPTSDPMPDCGRCGHAFIDHWMGHAPCAVNCTDTCRVEDFTGRTDEAAYHGPSCCNCPCYETPYRDASNRRMQKLGIVTKTRTP